VLPATTETAEQFQWLAQEAERDHGRSTLRRVERVESLTTDELIRRFRDARNTEYRGLTETLLALCARRDPALAAMAEIVHETDLRDGKYPRDEARGLDLAIRGLLVATPDDAAMLATGLTMFEGLYTTLGGTGR
jgi:hypothetical protein